MQAGDKLFDLHRLKHPCPRLPAFPRYRMRQEYARFRLVLRLERGEMPGAITNGRNQRGFSIQINQRGGLLPSYVGQRLILSNISDNADLAARIMQAKCPYARHEETFMFAPPPASM